VFHSQRPASYRIRMISTPAAFDSMQSRSH
jgi:hypothetical protein